MDNIKAILIDIGGVLVRTSDRSLREKWERQLDLPKFELDNIVFGSDVAQQSTIGKASRSQVWESVKQVLKISDAEMNELKKDFWGKDFVDVNLLQVLRNLHVKYSIFILSNAWEGARASISESFNLIEGDPFDRIFFSSEMGMAKPDPEIFREISKTIQTPLYNILFIDDFIENIESAMSLGINTCHFRNPKDVMILLETLAQ